MQSQVEISESSPHYSEFARYRLRFFKRNTLLTFDSHIAMDKITNNMCQGRSCLVVIGGAQMPQGAQIHFVFQATQELRCVADERTPNVDAMQHLSSSDDQTEVSTESPILYVSELQRSGRWNISRCDSHDEEQAAASTVTKSRATTTTESKTQSTATESAESKWQ